jgi:hypothetical protein
MNFCVSLLSRICKLNETARAQDLPSDSAAYAASPESRRERLGDTRMDGSPPSGAPIWLPMVILIIEIDGEPKWNPTHSINLASDALEITFPFKIMQGRRMLPAVT